VFELYVMEKECTSWTEADLRHGGEVPTVHGCGVALRQCVRAIRHGQRVYVMDRGRYTSWR